jgi:hypothetical protein
LVCRRRRNSQRRESAWLWPWILIWEGTKRVSTFELVIAQRFDLVSFRSQQTISGDKPKSPLSKEVWITLYNAGVWQ